MAMGAMQAIADAGQRIPVDIAVIGIDDVGPAAQAHPPLTTIRIPKRELARVSVEMALACIEGLAPSANCLIMPSLVVRQST